MNWCASGRRVRTGLCARARSVEGTWFSKAIEARAMKAGDSDMKVMDVASTCISVAALWKLFVHCAESMIGAPHLVD